MLQRFWFFDSLFLIFVIFLRMPQETVGLSSFANKSDLLGSPNESQVILNYITSIAVLIYYLLAITFNLNLS
uniref:Preprotein translocase SecG subunit n=1 Tax=Astrosyne radiata TaxID=1158023 RepID=A0A2U9NT36_9STRA|nr:preprotein translocase SecG subunit [Astrosyne radiata]AWT40291.1 preprotein translocase SecG subunit [Astrosyne radiata]